MQVLFRRIMMTFFLGGLLLVLVSTVGCQTKTIDLTGPKEPGGDVSFAADVKPILNASCGGGQCHIQQSTSGVQLQTREAVLNSIGSQYDAPIVDPGDASRSASPLVDKILPDPTHGQRMPLNDSPLDEEEISTIRSWIAGLSSAN